MTKFCIATMVLVTLLAARTSRGEMSLYVDGNKGNDRAEVVKQLLGTKDREGVFGKYSFDENGDITLTPYGVYKIENGALVFSRELRQEGKLGFWRWTSIVFGVAGTYRQNDVVDVIYESAAGGRTVASSLPVEAD